jgi:hypothetical protein
MTHPLALIIAAIVAAVGFLVFRSNSQRIVNRAVFAGTVQMAAWLVCWHLTTSSKDGLFWLRWTCSVGALAPLNFWIVKEAIVRSRAQVGVSFISSLLPWAGVSVVFVTIPFFDIFIPDHSTPSRPLYGWGYFFYLWGLLFVYAVLFISAFRSARKLHGGARLEMQVWLGGGCILAFAIYALMFLSAFTGNPIFRRAQPIATLFFYAGTAYAISHHRIFDAREIVVVGFKKAVLVFVIAIGGLLADRAFLRWDSFLKWLVVAGIVVVSLEILNRYIGSAFSFSTPDRRLTRGGICRNA